MRCIHLTRQRFELVAQSRDILAPTELVRRQMQPGRAAMRVRAKLNSANARGLLSILRADPPPALALRRVIHGIELTLLKISRSRRNEPALAREIDLDLAGAKSMVELPPIDRR
jgi:hypothetical protein